MQSKSTALLYAKELWFKIRLWNLLETSELTSSSDATLREYALDIAGRKETQTGFGFCEIILFFFFFFVLPMGIELDRDSTDSLDEGLDDTRDPFVYKVKLAEMRHFQLLQKVRSYSCRNASASKSSAMAQLVLQAKTEFTDIQMMNFLGLDPRRNAHLLLYDLVVGLVIYTARHLKVGMNAASLLDFPLTDIQDVCYRIADCFDSLFFIPVNRRNGLGLRDSFVWDDRFNGLWPIMYLLNREYNH